jgi:hypothetical protein
MLCQYCDQQNRNYNRDDEKCLEEIVGHSEYDGCGFGVNEPIVLTNHKSATQKAPAQKCVSRTHPTIFPMHQQQQHHARARSMSSRMDPAVLGPTDAARQTAFDQGASAGPTPFDPSEEYRRLLEAVDPPAPVRRNGANRRSSGSPAKPDSYQYLMSRERRVLDTVDRVVNDALTRDAGDRSLFGMPIHELAMRTLGAVRALFDDLVASRSLDDGLKALRDPIRMPFVGIALIALAVFMLFLASASG